MPQRPIEPFVVPVLPGTARMDIDGFNLDCTQPILQEVSLELTFVVTAKILQFPVSNKTFTQGLRCL